MSWLKISVLCVPALLAACGGSESSGDANRADSRQGSDFTPVIARIGDVEITQADFDYRYEQLSPGEKSRFSGENWKNRFLDYLVEETLFYRQAKEEKFGLLPDVQRRLEMAERAILVKAYYDKHFKDEISPGEEQIAEYYENNKELYVKLGSTYGYLIACEDKAKIDQAYAELEEGKPFKEVALRYSEEETSRAKGGDLGWFNPDGFVMGVGYSKLFTDTAFALEPNSYSEPVLIDDRWCIIKIGPKSETTTQPISEVRERIEGTLRPVLGREAYGDKLRELTATLGVERFGEYQDVEIRTAEQLYRLGSESRNPHAKLYYYQTIFEKYPEHEYYDDSLFMYGFISSEEFNDVAGASVAFRRLIREQPQSEFAEQASWMLKNLGSGIPDARGSSAPQNPAEAAARIEQQKG